MRPALSAGLRAGVLSLAASAAPTLAAAQQNPFALSGGPVTAAHVVYATTQNGKPSSMRVEAALLKGQSVLRIADTPTIGGKTDSAFTYIRTTRDSVYRWSGMGKARPVGEVQPSVRGALASAFDALDAPGKARVVANLRTLARGGADLEIAGPTVGVPEGSGTYAGHRCDKYRQGDELACVMTGTSHVVLYWERKGMAYTATSVKLGGSVPSTVLAPPAGVRFRPNPEYDGDGLADVLELAAGDDQEPPATPVAAARLVMRFLASPEAAGRLAETSGEAGD